MASSGPPDKPKSEETNSAGGDTLSTTTLQVQLQLGRTIESAYRALVTEPLPEGWLKLLDLLDEQQRKEEEGRNEDKSSHSGRKFKT